MQGLEIDPEDMIDPLEVIPLEEMKDYSLPSPNLTRDELKEIYVQHDIYMKEKNNTQQLYTNLISKLKKRHPVRSHLLHMQKEDLQRLYDVVTKLDKEGCHFIKARERGRIARLRMALIKYYFKTHPTCPLETLKQHLKCFENVDVPQPSNLDSTYLDIEGQKDPYLFKKIPSFVIQFSDYEDSSIKVPLEWSKTQVFAVFDSKPIFIEDYPHLGDSVRYKPKMSTKVSAQEDEEDYKKSMTTVEAQEKLERALKKIHPIHKVISSFKIKEASLLVFFTGHLQIKARPRSKLANICFERQPEAPIKYLETLINKYKSLGVEAKRTLMQDYNAALNEPQKAPSQWNKKLTSLQDRPLPGQEEYLKIPSFVIRHCDNEDYEDSSVEVAQRLSKEQILEEFEDREIPVKDSYKINMTIEQARAKLQKVLEKAHPIHQVISSLRTKEAGVLIVFAGSLPNHAHHSNLRSKLANICFEKQPEAPIAYLKTLHAKYESLDLEDKKILLHNYYDALRKH